TKNTNASQAKTPTRPHNREGTKDGPRNKEEQSTRIQTFIFDGVGDRLALHSFPTRRSSDLAARAASGRRRSSWRGRSGRASWIRSEEHTSELQSRSELVCRLLLEKKNPWAPMDAVASANAGSTAWMDDRTDFVLASSLPGRN